MLLGIEAAPLPLHLGVKFQFRIALSPSEPEFYQIREKVCKQKRISSISKVSVLKIRSFRR